MRSMKGLDMEYILEMRLSRKHEWEPLCEGTFSHEEVTEFFSSLDQEDSGLFRYRLLPQYGYDTEVFQWEPKGGWKSEGPLILSRDMPAHIHRLNDQILSALGV